MQPPGYRLSEIRLNEVAATIGTCPLPMALSRSTRLATV